MRTPHWLAFTCRRLYSAPISLSQRGPPFRRPHPSNTYNLGPITRSMSKSAPESPRPALDTRDDVDFHIIEDAEDMCRYFPGGYHLVSIGDKLNNRYHIVHKLGHGSYSTVWLARDERLQRLLAVKVCTGDASLREFEVLCDLKNTSLPVHRNNSIFIKGRHLLPSILDSFHVNGPHGTHACYVMKFTKGSLAKNVPLPLEVARAIAAQVILAVAYMHHNGYVHGDLHMGNIQLRNTENLDNLSDEELYEEFGEPEYEQVRTFDDKPIPLNVPKLAVLPMVFPVELHKLSLADSHIVLADLGEVYRPSQEERLECRTAVHCRPPEDRFMPTQPRSFPSDIWTLACTIWGIMGSIPIFQSIMACPDETTSRQVELLGKLPQDWWEQWQNRSEYFTEDGELVELERCSRPRWGWEYSFESDIQNYRKRLGMELMSIAEKDVFLDMLSAMLKYKPEDRCSIRHVVDSKWMRDWALPAYDKLPQLPTNTATNDL